MISKNLSRRLERLEAEIMPPEGKTVVLNIQFVTSELQVVGSQELKIHIPPRPARPRRW